jgi:TetR/AcrR family tetracycline transcriptional repressor
MDEVGVDGLTMRRLAEKLGVTAGSLYRHVRDKDELVGLLADELSGQVPPIDESLPWPEALRTMARAHRRVLLSHRDAARLLASTPPAGPQRLTHVEAMLRLLCAAGFSARDAAWAGYHFNNVVTEFVADEVRAKVAADAAGTTHDALMERTRAQFRALPSDQFPNLIAAADALSSDDPDALFEFGLDLVIRGIAPLAAP